MKLFSLIHLLLFFKFLKSKDKKYKMIYSIVAGAMLVLTTYTKPNYTLGILVVIGLVFLYNFFVKKQRKILTYYIIQILPSVLMLLAQFSLTYMLESESLAEGGIALAFFKQVIQYNKSNPRAIVYSFFAMTLYPLASLVLFIKEKVKLSLEMKIVYLFTVVQLFFYFFVVESGERAYHGNFTWGYCGASFILFLFTTVEAKKITAKWQKIVLCFFQLCHLVCGVAYIIVLPTYGYY